MKLTNAAVNPGGEIEKRKAFIKVATLTGTYGLAAVGSNIYAFTRNQVLTPPSIGITDATGNILKYQKLPLTNTAVTLADYDVFDGKLYVSVLDPSGTTNATVNPHYYDGVLTQGAGKGIYVRAYQSKVYCVQGKLVSFSAVGDPSNWTTGTGAGFINISLQEATGEGAQALEVYYDKLVVMSRETTQIWDVDPDPSLNAISQILSSTGTLAPKSVQQYGSGDILYLTSSGIRSLKARDSSNSAAVTDIGSPVDAYVQALRAANGEDYIKAAQAILEPIVGRFWMVFPNQILVLSYFPGPKITAWSVYTTPFTINYAVTANDRIFVRSGDDLYLYGGVSGNEYDNTQVDIELPFLDIKKPAHNKEFLALDATVTGAWSVKAAFNYDQPTAEDTIATVSSSTWNKGRIPMQGYSTHVSLRFSSTHVGRAMLSNAAIHYAMADDEA